MRWLGVALVGLALFMWAAPRSKVEVPPFKMEARR